ncbi:hypothetical protein [Halorubrum salsamenti]|uniref:hypothetical protein n=1 Tax=Halorubrum salsamenti TaxID=2583990 RepID=UPI001F4F4EE0|nr:hypothetical protein [Halorubrum salsamenti]
MFDGSTGTPLGLSAGVSRGRSVAHAARRRLPAFADTGSDEEHLSAAADWLFRSQDAADGGESAATYNRDLAAYTETLPMSDRMEASP